MTTRIAKTCPGCGQPQAVARDDDTGREILVCGGFPNCEYTEEMPTDVRQRLAGAPTLPGFE